MGLDLLSMNPWLLNLNFSSSFQILEKRYLKLWRISHYQLLNWMEPPGVGRYQNGTLSVESISGFTVICNGISLSQEYEHMAYTVAKPIQD